MLATTLREVEVDHQLVCLRSGWCTLPPHQEEHADRFFIRAVFLSLYAVLALLGAVVRGKK